MAKTSEYFVIESSVFFSEKIHRLVKAFVLSVDISATLDFGYCLDSVYLTFVEPSEISYSNFCYNKLYKIFQLHYNNM